MPSLSLQKIDFVDYGPNYTRMGALFTGYFQRAAFAPRFSKSTGRVFFTRIGFGDIRMQLQPAEGWGLEGTPWSKVAGDRKILGELAIPQFENNLDDVRQTYTKAQNYQAEEGADVAGGTV